MSRSKSISTSLSDDIEIFQSKNGEIVVDVHLHDNTVWLNLNQLSTLFDRDKSVVSRHLRNIFKEQELERSSVVAFFATTAKDQKTYDVEYFNLDAILSVGYRVNSKQGTQFRKWATQTLQNYIIKGYALNQKHLTEKRVQELEQALDLMSKTLVNNSLTNEVGTEILHIIQKYAKTWETLLAYDENRLGIEHRPKRQKLIHLSHKDVSRAIQNLKHELMQKGEASELFGHESGQTLAGILGNIAQTFDSKPVYNTNLKRAAHLLYFIIKDHPFSDGNKRIDCLLFLVYLSRIKSFKNRIDNNSLIALALLIAESAPSQKDIILQLIERLLQK